MQLRAESSPLGRLIILGLGLCAGIAALFIRRFSRGILHLVYCPLREATGIPCPTCGSAHAAVALTHGRLWLALSINPVMTAAMILFGVAVLWSAGAMVIPAWRVELKLSPRDKRAARWLAALMLIGSWLYEIWRLI